MDPDRWLCVAAFRRLCSLTDHFSLAGILNFSRENIWLNCPQNKVTEGSGCKATLTQIEGAIWSLVTLISLELLLVWSGKQRCCAINNWAVNRLPDLFSSGEL
jgi:hypothetical protein